MSCEDAVSSVGRRYFEKLNLSEPKKSTDSVDMSLSKLQEMLKDRDSWRAAVLGVTKMQT